MWKWEWSYLAWYETWAFGMWYIEQTENLSNKPLLEWWFRGASPWRALLKVMYPYHIWRTQDVLCKGKKIAGQGRWGKRESRTLKANQGSYQFRLLIEAQTNSLDGHWCPFLVLIAYPYFLHLFTYSFIYSLIFFFI